MTIAETDADSVRQVMNEDRSHELLVGFGARDEIVDLRPNDMLFHPRPASRLQDCGVSIEHLQTCDLVAMSKRNPAQRRHASSNCELRSLPGVVLGRPGQRTGIGRAVCDQLDRQIVEPRLLGRGEPLPLRTRLACSQVAQYVFGLLVRICAASPKRY